MLGGRWIAAGTSTFQRMSPTERAAITIDGASVAEIDVSASHLSLLAGVLGQTLEGDPYAIPGVPRQMVKDWVVATLGKGSPVIRWAAGAGHGSDARQVGEAVMRRHAFLAEPWQAASHLEHLGPPRRVLPHFLMGLESSAITLAMGRLRGAGVLALPVHDSLIVPATHSDLAVRAMRDAWAKVAGIVLTVTVRGVTTPD
jgi:hypothetical protein